MKVVGAQGGLSNFEWLNPDDLHMDNAILILNRAIDPEEVLARDRDALSLEDVRSEDDVGNSGFIFK